MLIKNNDIVTLKKYVKVNFTATAQMSMPDIDAAERKYLLPILTRPVYTVLQGQVDANTITWNILLNLCRAAIAPLAVLLDLPFLQTQISDGGLKSTGGSDSPHQWEYLKVEKALANKGMAALENLIEHLIESAATYEWENPAVKESFIKTGNEFSKYATLEQPNLTFQQLKPLLKEAEDHFIIPAIGQQFFNELRDSVNPSAEEQQAILLIKKALVQYTLVRAIERLPVRITPNGLMASILENSEAFNSEPAAGKDKLIMLMQAAQREGDAYHIQLIEHLNTNANPGVFKTFFESKLYKAPATQTQDANYFRNGVCAL
jgi:hypothetical protein